MAGYRIACVVANCPLCASRHTAASVVCIQLMVGYPRLHPTTRGYCTCTIHGLYPQRRETDQNATKIESENMNKKSNLFGILSIVETTVDVLFGVFEEIFQLVNPALDIPIHFLVPFLHGNEFPILVPHMQSVFLLRLVKLQIYLNLKHRRLQVIFSLWTSIFISFETPNF